MRVAPPISLSSEQRKELEQAARARSLPARQVERARIVVRAADGWLDKDIAAELGITAEKAARWRRRFREGGVAALRKDAPRPGRPRTASPAACYNSGRIYSIRQTCCKSPGCHMPAGHVTESLRADT